MCGAVLLLKERCSSSWMWGGVARTTALDGHPPLPLYIGRACSSWGGGLQRLSCCTIAFLPAQAGQPTVLFPVCLDCMCGKTLPVSVGLLAKHDSGAQHVFAGFEASRGTHPVSLCFSCSEAKLAVPLACGHSLPLVSACGLLSQCCTSLVLPLLRSCTLHGCGSDGVHKKVEPLL